MTPPHAYIPRPDVSRKGWVVVGALFMMLAIVMTGRNSLGLMMPFWKADPGWSYGFFSTAGAVMLTVMAVVAPVAGLVLDRFGARVVYAAGMSLVGAARHRVRRAGRVARRSISTHNPLQPGKRW